MSVRTPHNGPHACDQIHGLGFDACAIVRGAEAGFGCLCAAPADWLYWLALESSILCVWDGEPRREEREEGEMLERSASAQD